MYIILKERRKELGVKQAELAAHVGFKHRSSIHNLEQGNIEWKWKDISKACELLKIEISVKKIEE